MSNLTSGGPNAPPPPPSASGNKRKRSLPGNPDPDAEVVALSPATLMATNRFLCEICGKGFQRDQNLQLHRRGHNLPWKLKQRGTGKEAQRRKVYVCPEASCVHHDPVRALGDLTGIKKHFFRKHGEKKWKCDKCSKKYAVHSDWKAHSKICGTREYKCDCGTIFSRRDSFITHRAFCDALTEESAKAIGLNAMAAAPAHRHPLVFSPPPPPQVMQHQVQDLASLQEHHHQEAMQPPQAQQQQYCNYAMKTEMPPWPPMTYDHHAPHPLLQPVCGAAAQSSATSAPPLQLPAASAHLSATALLQKAAQMGATIGGAGAAGAGAHYTQMAGPATSAPGSATFGLGLPGLNAQQQADGVMGGLARTASHGRSGEDGGGGGGDGMTRDFLGLRALSHRDILGLAGFDSSCMGAVTATANMSCYEQPQQHEQAQAQAQAQQQNSNEPWHGMGSHS
ncbi:Protein indeterminate-domain 9 [Dichanthelium oligosanthes]|uniref:Protein EARLY HEADING DATE 2 n=1 Tax=Dichanthelium oligosanthes TaxID=888268 RepID=A0A1E5VAW9_9POAL|nr:Protein indeterminate-domain 9 [Dichanthelium oligosanthes]